MENSIAEDAKIFKNVRLVNCNIGSKCTIGDDCDLDNTIMDEKSELGRRNLVRSSKLGKGSYTGTNTIIKFASIGKYCSLSWNLSIGGGSHDYTHTSMYTDYWYKRTFGIELQQLAENKKNYKTFIGNDVWIGAGAQILSGITIGDGCVIGAGAIVTKDIPPYSIVTGIPGKIQRKRFDEDIIEMLLQLRWWDWSEDKIKNNIDLLRNQPTVNKLKYLLTCE